ncbi:MAG: leucyl/phenylalanyl-tRNA--protein transferase [Candidatus Nanopelagicales bacterium]|nr:leucyl/phenylalanyl-tRNA--protein transferase [Candidatus Nanopelagicales bacterium]
MTLIDPGPCVWNLPDPRDGEPGEEILAIGADLAPSTLLSAYCSGLFPMHVSTGELAWWSPDPRGVMDLNNLQVSRSLRKSIRRYRVTFDTAFEAVMRGCDEGRNESWITDEFISSYCALHEMGWTHSVEVWDGDELVGGLYGIEVGGLFAGESMFHRKRDASKVAFVALVERLKTAGGIRLFDVQWKTDHLASLGVVEIPRNVYLDLLAEAVAAPSCFSQ